MFPKSIAVAIIGITALVLVLALLVAKGGSALLVAKGAPPPAPPGDADTKGAPPAATEDAELHGKCVWVVLEGPTGKGIMLQNVRVKRLGERKFLVGIHTLYDIDLDDLPERADWVPVDEVKALSVYNSKDDARKRSTALKAISGQSPAGAKNVTSFGDDLPPLSPTSSLGKE